MVERNILTVDVLEGVERSEECPLCYLWLKDERRNMEYVLMNEVTMSKEFRGEILASKGFCNYHAHLLYRIASEGQTEDGLGYAMYMQAVINRIIEQLESLPLGSMSSLENHADSNILPWVRRRRQAFAPLLNNVEHAVQGENPCPICRSLWTSDELHLDTLVKMLDDKDFRVEFRSSKGLCLSHFASAIRIASLSDLKNPADVARALIEAEIKRLQLTACYLSEFMRKQNWKFRNESPGPEVNAYYMSLRILDGVGGLYCRSYRAFSPWELDDR